MWLTIQFHTEMLTISGSKSARKYSKREEVMSVRRGRYLNPRKMHHNAAKELVIPVEQKIATLQFEWVSGKYLDI